MNGLRILSLLMVAIFFPFAEATYSKVFCQTLLSPSIMDSIDQTLLKRLLSKDRFRVDVDRRAKNAAFSKIGLDGDIMRGGFLPLSMGLVADESTWVHPLEIQIFIEEEKGQEVFLGRSSLKGAQPSVWQTLVLNLHNGKINFQKLIEEYSKQDGLENQRGAIKGYHTEVDADGVRAYITDEYPRVSVLGIDVPCAHVDNYIEGMSFHVITRWGEFCRVPILYFK